MAEIQLGPGKTNVIQGLDDIKKKLKIIERKVGSRAVDGINRAAANAGARALQKVADKNLPIAHKGKKKLDIQRSRRESAKKGYDVFKIGPKIEHWELLFLEYGASAHDILPKKAQAMLLAEEASDTRNIRTVGVYSDLFVKKVKHTGIFATHFLSRALFEGDDEAYKAIAKRYWQRIRKALK